MTPMQKIVLLLTFWFSPPSAQKQAEWEAFLGNSGSITEDGIVEILGYVAEDLDSSMNWSALDQFKADVSATLN
jgi:hypothetical protein